MRTRALLEVVLTQAHHAANSVVSKPTHATISDTRGEIASTGDTAHAEV